MASLKAPTPGRIIPSAFFIISGSEVSTFFIFSLLICQDGWCEIYESAPNNYSLEVPNDWIELSLEKIDFILNEAKNFMSAEAIQAVEQDHKSKK